MKRLFGTDGIRGVAGEFPLNRDTVFTIGKSLARHLGEHVTGRNPLVMIGRDTRESGPWIEQYLNAGVLAGGAKCRSAGVITTPGVAFLTRSENADAGVVISASHNPYHDNGIKVFAPSGKKISDDIERQIEKDIRESHRIPAPDASEIDSSTSDQMHASYLNFLANVAGELDLQGLKIVVDCANGAAYQLAPQLFRSLGADVAAINVNPDGRNINRDCGSLHLDKLQESVVEQQATIGVAFDGDADRALFADSQGRVVDGDATLWILAQDLDRQGLLRNGEVVATVMSNIGLEKALDSRGWKLARTDVGDKNVLDQLLKSGDSIGGEQSGHIIMPDLSLAGDGIVTAILVLRALTASGTNLEKNLEGFRTYPQILVNVRVREKIPFNDVPEISTAVLIVEERLRGNGRLLLRYSGTEPLARIMLEGESQTEIDTLANGLASTIRTALG